MASAPPVQQPIERSRRPIILTLICIFATVGAIANLARVAFGPPSKLGEWFLPSLAVSALVVIAAMIGVWQMRRWAVYAYIGICVLGQIELIVMLGHFNVTALLLRCVVVVILIAHFKKMR
jgi:hypothetical protein